MFYRSLTLNGVVAAITLAAFVIMMGCNSHGPTSDGSSTAPVEEQRSSVSVKVNPASFHLHSGAVLLRDVEVDSSRSQLTIEYDRLLAGGSEPRTLQIKTVESGDIKRVQMTVVDGQGDLEILLGFSYNESDSTTLWIEEATSQDTLVLKRTLIDNRMCETYTYQGISFYADFIPEELERVLARRSLGLDSQPVAKQGIGESLESKVDEFLEFYPWDCSLNNNTEGQLAVELITDIDVLNWIAAQEGLPEIDFNSRLSLDELCEIATVASFKCAIVGIANFICHAAIGVNVVCAFFTVLDWLGVDH